MQVSELLGSFGDNELSPECLEGVARLLRPGGVSIPAAYTSFLAPACTHAVHAAIKGMGKAERFEVGMVVRLWKHVVLAAPAAVFTFEHPDRCAPHLTVLLGVRVSVDALCALLDCALGFFPCYFLFGCNRQALLYNRKGR